MEKDLDNKSTIGQSEKEKFSGFRHSDKWLFGTMLVSALISLFAAFELSKDAVILASNPNATFGCDINTVLSCGKVGLSPQASLFGFPNAFFGLMCEPVVITIAVAGLSGVKFPKWFMVTAQFVYFLGLMFAYWLFYQSYVVIGALCPFCLLITLGTTLVFFTLLHVNIRDRNFGLKGKAKEIADFMIVTGINSAIAILTLLLIIVLILVKYGPFLFQ